MKIETPKFNVEYKGATFTFKYGTERDLLEIIKADKEGHIPLRKHFQSRLIAVSGLEIDGKDASVSDLMDLPSDVINEIIGQWVKACIDFKSGGAVKKKKSTKKSQSA